MEKKTTGYEMKSVVENYDRYRPKAPLQVYDKIFSYLGLNVRRDFAIDAGCGPGQSTLPLCKHFQSVTGIDSSEAQLEKARQLYAEHQNVVFKTGYAEELTSTFQKDSVDLITVGTALHWFDFDTFFLECNQVLKEGGVLAAYLVNLVRWENEEAHNVIHRQIIRGVFDSYYPPLIQNVWNNYEKILPKMKLHFDDLTSDNSVKIECNYSIADILGYMKSFPQYFYYKDDHPENPDEVDLELEKLIYIFGRTALENKVIRGTAPVSLFMGRK